MTGFRGTHGKPDALLDAVFWRVHANNIPGCDGCSVEKGFSFAQEQLANPLNDALESMIKAFPDYRVIFTGHSLGGGKKYTSHNRS